MYKYFDGKDTYSSSINKYLIDVQKIERKQFTKRWNETLRGIMKEARIYLQILKKIADSVEITDLEITALMFQPIPE